MTASANLTAGAVVIMRLTKLKFELSSISSNQLAQVQLIYNWALHLWCYVLTDSSRTQELLGTNFTWTLPTLSEHLIRIYWRENLYEMLRWIEIHTSKRKERPLKFAITFFFRVVILRDAIIVEWTYPFPKLRELSTLTKAKIGA